MSDGYQFKPLPLLILIPPVSPMNAFEPENYLPICAYTFNTE